jgi:hypothetical protein
MVVVRSFESVELYIWNDFYTVSPKKYIIMTVRLLLGGFLLASLPFLCNAQEKVKEHDNGKMKTKEKPKWAAAHHYNMRQDVYFPDYYTFYDPEQGYYYYSEGKWTTSSNPPDFLQSADLNNARMEVIKEEIRTDPQKEYIIYRKRYPARKVEITVPEPPMQ